MRALQDGNGEREKEGAVFVDVGSRVVLVYSPRDENGRKHPTERVRERHNNTNQILFTSQFSSTREK